MSDPDVRVKIKAIDILGAREANGAIPTMSRSCSCAPLNRSSSCT